MRKSGFLHVYQNRNLLDFTDLMFLCMRAEHPCLTPIFNLTFQSYFSVALHEEEGFCSVSKSVLTLQSIVGSERDCHFYWYPFSRTTVALQRPIACKPLDLYYEATGH